MNDSKLNVILHRSGDQSPVTINQDKCLIRTIHNNVHIDCCAIFNGPHGTALRSYTENVLVNGQPTSAQWLNPGDQIQLPCSTRIEVKTATTQRAVLTRCDIANSEVSAPLSESLQASTSKDERVLEAVGVASAVVESPEETFLSPFSSDLAEIDEKLSEAAVSQQVTESEAVASLPEQIQAAIEPVVTSPIAESPIETSGKSTTSEDLESIFARLGVMNVGTIKPPVSPQSAPAVEPVAPILPEPVAVEPIVVEPTIEPATVEPVLIEPVAVELVAIEPAPVEQRTESDTDAELAANIRKQLESVFADSLGDTSAPQPTESIAAPSTPEIPAAAEQFVNTPALPVVPDVEPSAVPQMLSPSIPESSPETNQPTPVLIPQPVAAPVVETPPTPQNDPLSELPSDLRNQLNDLVSSLEQETVEASVVEVPVVETANVSLEPTPIESTAATPQPIDDDSISNMLDAALRSVQGLSEETPAPVAPVSQSAVDVPTRVEPPIEPVAIEPVPVGPVVPVAPPVEKSQSVADILGSMGMQVPGMEEMKAPPAVAASTPEPIATEQASAIATVPNTEETPAPAPAAMPAPTSPVFADMQSAPQEQAQPQAATNGGDADDDIQAYMDRLLNRTSKTPEPASDQGSAVEGNAVPEAPVPVPAAVAETATLTAEDFVPSHRPSRPENYDTLREIANSSSRSAVRQSSKKARKESIMIKLVACLISLVCAAVTFWFGMIIPAEVFLVIAIGCGGLLFLNRDPVAKAQAKVVRNT